MLEENLRDEQNMLDGVNQIAAKLSKKEERETAEIDSAT